MHAFLSFAHRVCKVCTARPTKLHRHHIRLHPDWNAAKLSVAAFVEDLQTGEVLQALALPGCMPAAG